MGRLHQTAVGDRIQYNNIFRMILGSSRYCSASGMFSKYETDGFATILREKDSIPDAENAGQLQRHRTYGSWHDYLSDVVVLRVECDLTTKITYLLTLIYSPFPITIK